MKSIKNISIVGLGAIGGVYSSKLYDMDPESIKVIAGGMRAKRYKENGFIINGKRYDFTYIAPEESCQPADLIIVSVKANQLAQAIKDMRNHVGDSTIILSLMNGISSEEIIGKEFGMDKILYGMCVSIDANRNNNEIKFTSHGNINFGEKINKEYSTNVQALKEVFVRAGIEYTIPEDMIRAMWWKFMINVGVNQTSAVLKARYGVFQAIPEAKKLMEATMWEVIRLSQKMGINLDGEDIDKWYNILYSLNPDSKTSMLEDIECCRETEVEVFAGKICELGMQYGMETPVNEMLLNIIKAMEKMY